MGRTRTWAGVAVVVVLTALAAACGGDDAGEGPDPAGMLTDEEYLATYCTGLAGYQAAVIGQTTRAAIAAATARWAERLSGVVPPRDLADYNGRFVAYLQEGAKEPSLLRREPPAPPEAARERLASKEAKVPECGPGAFGQRAVAGE